MDKIELIDKENIITIKKFNKQNIHIVVDFDRTITTGYSENTWNMFAYNDKMPKDYPQKMKDLYNYYRPIETDLTLTEEYRHEKMREWVKNHLKLLIESGLTEDIVHETVFDENLLTLREGMKELFNICEKYKIPIIIISAGMGTLIVEFLKHFKILFDNVYVLSNFLLFKDGNVEGFTKNIIYAHNKNEHELPENTKELIKDRPNVILIGDSIDDIKMVSDIQRENTFAVGLLEENIEENLNIYKSTFDMVLTNNSSIALLNKLILSL